jgi:hypothetical protein
MRGSMAICTGEGPRPCPILSCGRPQRRDTSGHDSQRGGELSVIPRGVEASALGAVSGRRWVCALVALLAGRILFAIVAVPPWQQPDEHAHVAVAEVWRTRLSASGAADPGREQEILASMADHGWWRHYGKPTPGGPIPARFGLVPDPDVRVTIGIDPTWPEYHPLYYRSVAWLLSHIRAEAVTTDLYVMRGLSGLCALLTLYVAWRAAYDVFGVVGAGAVAGTLAVHPQFLIVSTSASPDAAINLAGAVFWWQALRSARAGTRVMSLAFLAMALLAAVVGSKADRMGVPLLAMVPAVILLVAAARGRLWLGAAIMAYAIAAVLLGVAFEDRLAALRHSIGEQLLPVPEARTDGFWWLFTTVLFKTWWFALGWIRYLAPAWWMWAATVLSAAALAGFVRRVFQPMDTSTRIWIALAVAMIAVQACAIYWTFFRAAVGPQGRYLMPVVVPTLMLLWMGIQAWVPSRSRSVAAAGLIVFVALLDVCAWLFIGLPAYMS